MSFCCGGGMVATTGTLKHEKTYIHHVPLLFCPVCHRVEVHHLVEEEYDILAEYAHGDGAQDVDFTEYVNLNSIEGLYENCLNHADDDPEEIIQLQIDNALDLMSFAKHIGDADWLEELKQRLRLLNERRNKWRKRRTTERR